jgi:hypothetical protein
MEIPADFVPKYYRMNPKTDDLLPSATHLAEGMIILIEDPNRRENLPDVIEFEEEWKQDRIRKFNRWCRVSNVEFLPGDFLKFVGTYADGTKVVWSMMHMRESWIVKIDSITDSATISTSRYRNVSSMVDAMLRSVPTDDLDSHVEQVEEITDQLLKVL